jgi:hypothetical protein
VAAVAALDSLPWALIVIVIELKGRMKVVDNGEALQLILLKQTPSLHYPKKDHSCEFGDWS